jgi:hypothetical protein
MQMRPNPVPVAGRARPPDSEQPFSAPGRPPRAALLMETGGPRQIAPQPGGGPAGAGAELRLASENAPRCGWGAAPLSWVFSTHALFFYRS